MAKIKYLIEIYQKLLDEDETIIGWSTTPDLIIEDSIAWDSDGSIETTADTFTVRLENTKLKAGGYAFISDTGELKVKVDDRVLIYITAGTDTLGYANEPSAPDPNETDPGGHLIFDGQVSEITSEVNPDNRLFLIKGVNRLEKLLSFSAPSIFKQTSTFKSRAPNIIVNLLSQINKSTIKSSSGAYPNQIIGGGLDDATGQLQWIGNCKNPWTDNDGFNLNFPSGESTAFPVIQYWRDYKPVFELIEELSRKNINKVGNFYYYLDQYNRFIWRFRGTDAKGVTLTEGTDLLNIKITEKVWDVVNAMIVDAGSDPRGRRILAFSYNPRSAAEYGLRWAPGLEVEREIARTISEDQHTQTTAPAWADTNNDDFPDAYTGGGFLMTFQDRNSDGTLIAGDYRVANDNAYNSAIRKEAKWTAIAWINSILEMTGHVTPKISVSMQGSHWESGVTDKNGNTFKLRQGDPIIFVVPSRGWTVNIPETTRTLRLVEMDHNLDSNGWII